MTDQNEKNEITQTTSEKIIEATKKTIHNATFKANQYKKIVQKKIDLNAVQKKIATAHTDLGKQIDDLREAGEKGIISKPVVKEQFSQIDTLKQAAADLLADIETLKNTEESPEQHSTEDEPEGNDKPEE